MPETMTRPDCDHHFTYHVRGGEPLDVGICTLCGEVNWPDLRRQYDTAFRAGREAAAGAITAHADEHAPKPGPGERFDVRDFAKRQHFLTAARVAAGPMSTADVVDAIRQGNFAACYLDESGRPVDVEGETS